MAWARGAWREREYDSARREVGLHYSDPSLDCAFARDVFGALVGASNAVAQAAILRDNPGMATNETTATESAYDTFSRRVRKVTPTSTHTFLYDGWNVVREEVRDVATGAITDVYDYY